MSLLVLSTIGGIISAVSTSAGSLLAPAFLAGGAMMTSVLLEVYEGYLSGRRLGSQFVAGMAVVPLTNVLLT